MTDTPASAGQPPFAALVAELVELGFTAAHYPTAGPRQFTAPGTTLSVVIDDGRTPPRAVLTAERGPAWQLTLTGPVPDDTQVAALHAALHQRTTATTSA
ncbi:MAG TPA: hypothetical protein VH561_13840 [Micromonosporaceae bacterium]|jgi:hypothetical protein